MCVSKFVRLILLPVLLLATACSSDGGGITEPEVERPTSTMSATIGDGNWTAVWILPVQQTTRMKISARDNQFREIMIELTHPTRTGVYNIGPASIHKASFTVGTDAWASHLNGASGTITLNSLSETASEGTFSLVLAGQTPTAVGTRKIVGTFDVAFLQKKN